MQVRGIDLKAIRISNNTGQVLMTQDAGGNDNTTLNIASLPAGIYFVHVTDTKGNEATGKLIKE